MAAFSLQIRLLRKRKLRYHARDGQVNAAMQRGADTLGAGLLEG
jgi:hypothetical protein